MGEKLPTFFKTIKIDFTVALPLVNYVCRFTINNINNIIITKYNFLLFFARYLTICGEDAKMVMSIVKTVISLYNKVHLYYYY